MPYVTEENLTGIVAERWSNVPDPRLRKIMTSLIEHLHAWVRDIEPTEAEWFTAIDFLTRTGKTLHRQTPGIHPAVRHTRRQHACRRDQSPAFEPRRRRQR